MGEAQIELFSFPNPPRRVTNPEACGLRHLAFAVEDVEKMRARLVDEGLDVEEIRIDPTTGKRYFFSAIRTICRWKSTRRRCGRCRRDRRVTVGLVG